MPRLSPGVCSVTFRQLGVQEIIELVKKAKLECIEWGGDIHVPHGDLKKAHEVKQLMQDAHLKSAAYGSYYRVGESENSGLGFACVLATAKALGAPTIRVWAGTKGSDEATDTYKAQVIQDARRIATLAANASLSVSLEFHRNTLTDSNKATLDFLAACNHKNLCSFWQPPHHKTVNYRAEGLTQLLEVLTNVHVFYWPEPGLRRPLSEAETEWKRYLSLVKTTHREHPLLLEFVENDNPEAFLRDAKTLLGWL